MAQETGCDLLDKAEMTGHKWPREIRIVKTIIRILLFINFLGICGFWTVWLINPDEPVTIELATHIGTEYLTGILCLASFIFMAKPGGSSHPHLFIALGMLLYSSLNASGWTILNQVYPLLILMGINTVAISIFALFRLRGT